MGVLTLLQNGRQELVIFAKLAFQLLQLIQHPGHQAIAFAHIRQRADAVRQALLKQPDACSELGPGFRTALLFQPDFRFGTLLVDGGVDAGDIIGDRRFQRGIVTAHRRQHALDHVQAFGQFPIAIDNLLQGIPAVGLGQRSLQLGQGLAVAIQRLRRRQETEGALGQPALSLGQLLFKTVDTGFVGIAPIIESSHPAAMIAQTCQVTDKLIRCFPAIRFQVPHQRALVLSDLGNGSFGLGANTLDFLILIQHQLCGASDGAKLLI